MLDGRIYRPEATEDAPLQDLGMVLCHGYTGVQSLYFPDIARRLCDFGAIVLTFDYKGWGESEGPRNRLAPYGRVADVRAAVTFLTQGDQNRPNRVGLMGWSFGGSTAVVAGAFDERVE